MKKNKYEISRLKTIIDNDKISVTNKFEELFSLDLSKILNDYFELKEKPCLNITKNGGEYLVEINFVSIGIKNFSIVGD